MPLSCGKRLNKNEYSSSFMNFIHAIEGFVPIAGFFNFQKKQEFPIRSIFEKTINKTKEKSVSYNSTSFSSIGTKTKGIFWSPELRVQGDVPRQNKRMKGRFALDASVVVWESVEACFFSRALIDLS